MRNFGFTINPTSDLPETIQDLEEEEEDEEEA